MKEKSLLLHKKDKNIAGEISICGSKSESNRLLILNSLFDNKISISNLSDSDDTRVLKEALSSNAKSINIGHAGTAMRFLTAYYSIKENLEVELDGSDRMRQRPIGVLVDALNALGAEINYLENHGFPPLKIKGKSIIKDHVSLEANISSQFITALLLIAPKLTNGLNIELKGEITSLPYLLMTEELLKKLGIRVEQKENQFIVYPKEEIQPTSIEVESDWSSASYFYSLAAISDSSDLKISSFRRESLQGDSDLQNIYKEHFGVNTFFENQRIQLVKNKDFQPKFVELNLNETPDLAQTIAVSCAALKTKCKLTGLATLKVKETDRLVALKNELQKIGALSKITEDTLEIIDFIAAENLPKIKTYDDHRMALSFAPYSLIQSIEIENPEVVNKSYPKFWEDLAGLNYG